VCTELLTADLSETAQSVLAENMKCKRVKSNIKVSENLSTTNLLWLDCHRCMLISGIYSHVLFLATQFAYWPCADSRIVVMTGPKK